MKQIKASQGPHVVSRAARTNAQAARVHALPTKTVNDLVDPSLGKPRSYSKQATYKASDLALNADITGQTKQATQMHHATFDATNRAAAITNNQ